MSALIKYIVEIYNEFHHLFNIYFFLICLNIDSSVVLPEDEISSSESVLLNFSSKTPVPLRM